MLNASRMATESSNGHRRFSGDGDFALIGRLLHDYVGPRKVTLALAVLCMIGGALMPPILAWLLDPAIKYIFIEKRPDMVTLIPLAILVVITLRFFFNYTEATLNNSIGQGVVADVQRDMFKSLVRLDMADQNAVHSAQFVSRFLYDATLLREGITKGAAGVGREFLMLIFLGGLMIYQNWRLALLSVVIVPVIGYAARRVGKKMRKATKKSMEETGELSRTLAETLDGRRIVKAYNLEDDATARAEHGIARRLKFLMKGVRARAMSVPLADFLGGLSLVAVVFYAGYEGIHGRLEFNQFASFIAAMLMAQQPVRNLSQLWSVTTEGLGAASRVFGLIDMQPAIVDAADARPLRIAPPPIGGNVRFKDVTFAYHENAAALSGVSLDFPAGKKIALVGPSGSGKSTVFNLLLRFYEADSGRIEFDNQEIHTITIESLRRAIALVSQDAFLFDETIRTNIAWGRAGASNDEIIAAAQAAAAHDFITALPNGYDSLVGEGGLRLSGGERQRIAIARAMLRDAPILLLDEATSALDTENERQVQEALKRLMRGRTTIVIAHRLTTVLDADRIYVMELGRVVEQGTHGELMARGGLYARLYSREFSDDKPATATAS
jgi:ATP-binding cassette, subfamily B, bacterial MsbA